MYTIYKKKAKNGGKMKNQMSFSHIEKELLPEMRNKLNHAEDSIDVGNYFRFTINNLLLKVFENEALELGTDDIAFNPEVENYYSVSPQLLDHPVFKRTWEQSDLSNVVQRFAETSYNRHIHLNKNLKKTNLKIRKS
jgi:hypothetical protein